MLSRREKIVAWTVAAFILAASALVVTAAATWDLPVDVNERSVAAVAAWSSFASVIATALLLLAAIWAGLRIGQQIAIADKTRRGALRPVAVGMVDSSGKPDRPEFFIPLLAADAGVNCNVENLGPGPAVIGKTWLWILPGPKDDSPFLSTVEADLTSRGDAPSLPIAEAHYWTTFADLPPAGVDSDRLLPPWHRSAAAMPTLSADEGVEIRWRTDYLDIFDDPYSSVGRSHLGGRAAFAGR